MRFLCRKNQQGLAQGLQLCGIPNLRAIKQNCQPGASDLRLAQRPPERRGAGTEADTDQRFCRNLQAGEYFFGIGINAAFLQKSRVGLCFIGKRPRQGKRTDDYRHMSPVPKMGGDFLNMAGQSENVSGKDYQHCTLRG